MKPLFSKKERRFSLKARKVKWQMKPDHRLRTGTKHPEDVGAFNLSDRWNQLTSWLKVQTDYVLEKAFSNLIPRWFFIAILGIIILVILWFIFT